MNAAQREQLLALGPAPSALVDTAGSAEAGAAVAVSVPDGPRPKRTREQALTIAVDAAAAYRNRVWHLEVPRGKGEMVTAFDGCPEDVRLGVWVTPRGSVLPVGVVGTVGVTLLVSVATREVTGKHDFGAVRGAHFGWT
ncbi:hypothetical protein [Embleya sp. NPDC020630]|uniref:hypothetical protein n=1 Tax=Embleya sp. NPDC020630 TaxID=3363979 RepID=UPI003798C129